jgi:hypothetical protein
VTQHRISADELGNLGPLAQLIGAWEGVDGHDVAPSASRGIGENRFRERTVFTSAGRVDNHEQILYGVKFATIAYRLGEDNAFHEEFGIWLWDAARSQIMRCFVVPRGISVLAGGTWTGGEIRVAATLGSPSYGICSNVWLDDHFKTLSYELAMTIDGDALSYEADTSILIKGRAEAFAHRDRNTLRRVEV